MSFTYKLTKADEVTRSDGLVIKITPGQASPELQEYWAWQNERSRVAVVQQWMDDVAQTFEFVGGIDSVGSFTTSPNAEYASQAKKLQTWRDAVWRKFEEIRSEDFTVEQIKKRLPAPPVI